MGVLLALAIVVAVGVSIALQRVLRRYTRERDENRRVRSLFSRYVPEQVVDELLERNDSRLFTAQTYHATVLCARIRNFSLLAEALTPEQTLRYLNEFYAIAGRSIERRRGIIESLRGDTITAVFGVLIDTPFQEERALAAALEMVRLVNGMSARWSAQGRKPYAITVGVSTGAIVAGDVGFARRREFAVVGNTAHVAARLQLAAEELNAYILASATTFEPVAEQFVGVPASTLPLQGLKRLQKAYIVRGLAQRAEEELLRLPDEAAIAQTVVKPEEPPASEPEPASPPPRAAPREPFIDPPAWSGYDDLLPAMPEIPAVTGTYEDDSGPPISLPP
ncbi:MAG TPA: adenylate/guanylate cyclase domain-containing protein [Candidatus Baltobacteraceae bacterium]|jgi:adenylate cyclase